MRHLAALALFTTLSAHAFTLGSANLEGWDMSELVFNVNYENCTIPTEALDTAIDTAMAAWNSATTAGIRLARGASSSSAVATLIAGSATDVPVIACDPNFSTSTSTDADSVIGVGTFSTSGGRINYGYLLLNAQSGAAGNIANLSAASLAVVVAHEIGHVLGLGHSSDTRSVMYYNASAKTELRLSQDDVDGLSYLYPRSEFGPNAFGLACGSLRRLDKTGGGGTPQLLLAALLILCGSLVFRIAVTPRPEQASI